MAKKSEAMLGQGSLITALRTKRSLEKFNSDLREELQKILLTMLALYLFVFAMIILAVLGMRSLSEQESVETQLLIRKLESVEYTEADNGI